MARVCLLSPLHRVKGAVQQGQATPPCPLLEGADIRLEAGIQAALRSDKDLLIPGDDDPVYGSFLAHILTKSQRRALTLRPPNTQNPIPYPPRGHIHLA